MQLRPYQLDCLHHLESQLATDKNMMVKLPTGAGKTEVFISLVRNFPGRVLILLNRVQLLEQTKRRFESDGQECGAVCGSLGANDYTKRITVATIQTIASKENDYDLIIIDECHRARGDSYQDFLSGFKGNIIGFSATPFHSSGYLYGPEMDVKELAFEMSLNELTEMGYLVPISFKQTTEQFDTKELEITAGDFNFPQLEALVGDEIKINKQIDDALPRMKGRNKIVWACVGIDHAKKVQKILQSKGELVSIIHSELSYHQRFEELEQFERGENRHLVSITIVSEGYDFPKIDCIVMMRPTKSPVLYAQLAGRGVRLFEYKEDCLFLDYGEVVINLGHPNNPRIRKKFERAKDENQIKLICPSCFEMFFTMLKVCPKCSYVFEVAEEKDAIKNLTKTAWIPETSEKLIEVTKWEIDPNYTSKAGNRCIKVIYYSGFFPVQTDYLSLTGPGAWAAAKFVAETKNGTVMPKRILLRKDYESRWWKTVKKEFF